MSLSEEQIYQFANVTVDRSRECVLRAGEERHLRQKAFQVLTILLERRGQLVSKDELFGTVWSNTAVTDDVLVQCVSEIRQAIGDDTRNPKFIKTVPKSGYRFIGAVDEIYDGLAIDKPLEGGPERNNISQPLLSKTEKRRRYFLIPILLFFLVALIYGGWAFRPSTNVGNPFDGRKSVAVLFFENQSQSSDFEWLREGLADMLIAGLSRSEKLNLVGRDQLRDLADRSSSTNTRVSDVARQSRAEFLVSGTFAQIGDSVRIDVQLHDGKTGSLMTTETLIVEKAEKLLSQVDLLSLRISNRLNAAPTESREIATVMTDNLEAYRYYSLGVEKAHALHSAEAVELLEKAVTLDPAFAMAYGRIGYTYAVSAGELQKGKPYLERAFQLSARLTEKDRMNIIAWYALANQDFATAVASYRQIIQRFPFEIEAYGRLSHLLRGEGQIDEASEELRSGLALDPDAKDLYNIQGSILSGKGQHAEAINAHERYVALAANEPNAYDSLGLSYQWSGNYEKAIANYDRALELDPKFEIARIHLAHTFIRQGKYDQALKAFEQYLTNAVSDREKLRGINALAYIYLEKGDLGSAKRFAAKAVAISPTDAWPSYLIAVSLGENEQKAQYEKLLIDSSEYIDRGTRANPRIGLNYRGQIALNNGRNEQAIEYFKRAIAAPPPTWNLQDFEDCLGIALLRLGRLDEAIAEFQRIVVLNSNYPLVYFHLAEAYAAKGMFRESRESYTKFLDVWKDADGDVPQVLKAKSHLKQVSSN